jgi:hypothetical protein
MRLEPFYNYNPYVNQYLALPKIDKSSMLNTGINDIIKELNYQLTKKVEKPQKISFYA